MARPKGNNDGPSTSRGNNRGKSTRGARNRASPARLVKLYKHMSPDQCKLIQDAGFGGLLSIRTSKLPLDLIYWLLSNFDAESCTILIPGRGSIKITEDAVHRVFELPNKGDKVLYDFNVEAINFIHEKYQIDNAKAPTVKAIVTRLKDNKEPNEDYLRSWIMLAVFTFLSSRTSLSISPKCYPAVVNLSRLSKLNWCQFVIESLKSSVLKMRKRSSVGGCLLLLAVLYLDSLAVNDLQIPSCNPRIAAWNKKLIDKVIKLDTNRGGGFGRLKFKQSAYTTIQESCFGRIEDIENFVSLRIKPGVSNEKKRKLCQLVNTVTVAISDVIGQFIGQVFELIDEENHSNTSATASGHSPRLSKCTKYNRSFWHHPSASEDDEEEFEDGSDGDEEDEEEYEEESEEEDHEDDEEESSDDDDQDAHSDDDEEQQVADNEDDHEEQKAPNNEDDHEEQEAPDSDVQREPINVVKENEAGLPRILQTALLKPAEQPQSTNNQDDRTTQEVIKTTRRRRLRLQGQIVSRGQSTVQEEMEEDATVDAPNTVHRNSWDFSPPGFKSCYCKENKKLSQSSLEDDPTKGYIINYIEFYVGLEHLSQSVIPRGELVSSVAEVAICNINYDTPKSARKIVMPLWIASFLQEGELDRAEMKRVFRRELNHLDRLHQVVFPVLQTWKVRGTNTQTGHYFLLCLNLRENRFEVLDSMRSLSDEGLINCCNIIILAIKELWYKYCPNSRKKIENYNLVDIQVPIQASIHDCGFHMLMHAEYWNGNTLLHFKEEDMPKIRELLTYKWLTHNKNIAPWKLKLKLT
ncbi:hypothetical protein QOZ80_2BG0186340 [Eleusine coracana subsp. coracana]|nr:hypothetical protein QOZ80_2BG0186340 [Eleusine coracana subsp. coracana]